MIVKVNRSHGFYVGSKYYSVHPSPNPQFLPDEVQSNPSFEFVVKHGEIAILQPAAAQVEEAVESENPEIELESEDAAEGAAEDTESDEEEDPVEAGTEEVAAEAQPRPTRRRRSKKAAQ